MGNLPSSPANPTITEKNVGDQSGKVFLITGSTSGVGRELAQILYTANAKVWVAARSASKGKDTIEAIRKAAPDSHGQLDFLQIDLNDLSSIRPAANAFLERESRLDVLWNNAGVMIPPKGTVTEQGYEAQLGVNNVAPFLFTKLLTDILIRTASNSAVGETRVVWVSSSAAAAFSPKGGVEMEFLDSSDKYSQWQCYGRSKAGNILHAFEFARRYGDKGVISVAADPGNLDTDLYQNMPKWQHFIAKKLALKPPIYGAYTELFAGLSKDITADRNGGWVIPWGKVAEPRVDIKEACMDGEGSGRGIAKEFWEWCEGEVKAFA